MKRTLMMASLALSACAPAAAPTVTAPTPLPTPAAPGVMCDANKVVELIGKRAVEVSADAQSRSGARSVRTFRTGDPVTMDYRPDRLDIETDASGSVVKFSCG